jgi:hypothetical protein
MKKTFTLCLNLRSRLTIAPLLSNRFHSTLHCWIPVFKVLRLLYYSHPVTLFVFEKNEENLKKSLRWCLDLQIRLTIAPLLNSPFHSSLHCWIPLFKMLLLFYNNHPVTPFVFEKNEEN